MWELKVIFQITERIVINLNTKVSWFGLFKRNNNIPNQGKIVRPSYTANIILLTKGSEVLRSVYTEKRGVNRVCVTDVREKGILTQPADITATIGSL